MPLDSFTLPDFSQALHSQHYSTESHDKQIHIAAELEWLCNVTANAALNKACLLAGILSMCYTQHAGPLYAAAAAAALPVT